MTFIRSKEIPAGSGNWYDYEVETLHVGGKVIQRHIQYLGKSGIDYSAKLKGGGSVVQPIRTTPSPTIHAKPSRIYKMKTPAKLVASALGMYYNGMALDGIQQQFKQDHDLDMSESNYWNWVKRFTRQAIKQQKDFHPVVGEKWVADETYMKLGKQTVYFWDIIDADTSTDLHRRLSL